MTQTEDVTWPPSDAVLAWRPSTDAPADSVSSSALAEDGSLPDRVEAPDGVEPDEDGEYEIPAHLLAHVETDAGRPGGGGWSGVYAVPTTDGRYRIVIVNDDEIPFESPIPELDQLPTLGELLQIIDETVVDGEVYGVGHPTRVNSDSEHREDLRGFVRIGSPLYSALEPLDRSRLEQWIAERP